MDSPWVWFLLLLPVTATMLAYQYFELPVKRHHEMTSERPNVARGAARRVESDDGFLPPPPQGVWQVRTARYDDRTLAARPAHRIPDDKTVGSAVGTVETPLAATAQPELDSRIATTPEFGSRVAATPDAPTNLPVGTRRDAATLEIELQQSATEADKDTVDTELASILEENPYLPTVNTDTSPPCPEVLFRGGNEYARLRLAQMAACAGPTGCAGPASIPATCCGSPRPRPRADTLHRPGSGKGNARRNLRRSVVHLGGRRRPKYREEAMDVSYALSRELPETDYDAAVARVTALLADEGFGVLTEIDVKATLKKRLGLDFRRYVILGACNPQLAHRALEAEPAIGVLLPCNVVVTEREGGGSTVLAFRPEVAFTLVDNPAAGPLAREVESRLERVLSRLA